MDQDFAEVICLMIHEQGVEVLVNGKAKIFLSDYCKNQFKKEANIFRQILETGCGGHINSADNVLERKRKLMEKLEDDTGLSPKVTADYLDLLGLILKGDASKCGEMVVSTKIKQPASKSVPKHTKPQKSAPQPATQPVKIRQSAPNAISEDLVWIPGGTFMMGSPKSEPGRRDNEGPQHQVTASGFYIAKYQVTQEQYQAVMGGNPSEFTSAVVGESGTPGKLPVEKVSWYDAILFCNKLSIFEGLSPTYSIRGSTDPAAWGEAPTSITGDITWYPVRIVSGSTGYRLPTEVQWEYACRAGTTTAYNTGTTINDNTGWYKDNNGVGTHQVGLKTPNAWGLYDMHGNVNEWCWDWDGDYSSDAQTDPIGAATGTYRVWRGGGLGSYGHELRSAYRGSSIPYIRSFDIGFRLVRS